MKFNRQRIFASILGIAASLIIVCFMRQNSFSKSSVEKIVHKPALYREDLLAENLHGLSTAPSTTREDLSEESVEILSTHMSDMGQEYAIWEEQDRRQEILRDACQSLNISRPVEYSHMLVSDSHKTLFNFIPKVSCKTWKGVLSQLKKLSGTGRLYLRQYPAGERQYRLANYRKVLFVREPLSRILSAYMSKFRGGALYDHASLQRFWEQRFGKDIVRRYRGVLASNVDKHQWLNITLPEFINYITDLGSGIRMNELNDHWLPQHIVSHPCQIKYDFIGRFENLSVEGPFVLRWLGVGDLVGFPEYHNSNAVGSLVEYYKMIPLELIRKLGNYYSEDYRLFGYSLEETIGRVTRGVFHYDAKR